MPERGNLHAVATRKRRWRIRWLRLAVLAALIGTGWRLWSARDVVSSRLPVTFLPPRSTREPTTRDSWTRSYGCGAERWAEKTLSDDRAQSVIEGEPKAATIEQLTRSPPPLWSSRGPRSAEEMQYALDAFVYAYKLETDLDIHVIIADEHGSTMVAEFPHPYCVANPTARELIAAARQQLLALLPKPPNSNLSELIEPIPVRLRGVLFFDKHHGQIGGAGNGGELHPVLEVARR